MNMIPLNWFSNLVCPSINNHWKLTKNVPLPTTQTQSAGQFLIHKKINWITFFFLFIIEYANMKNSKNKPLDVWNKKKIYLFHDWFDFWCFNGSFNNISAISWRPVLVLEETGVPGYLFHQYQENKQPLRTSNKRPLHMALEIHYLPWYRNKTRRC